MAKKKEVKSIFMLPHESFFFSQRVAKGLFKPLRGQWTKVLGVSETADFPTHFPLLVPNVVYSLIVSQVAS